MKDKANITLSCVQVLAKITATISHDIKNTLSIINENAGLLEDLAEMAKESHGVPSERVQAATSIITKQVARSNTIIKNINRFAHSADTPMAHANIEEVMSLLVALTTRQAAMKNISSTISCPADLVIHTYLFPFESLLYLTLCRLYECAPDGSSLSIEVVAKNHNIAINFLADEQTDLTIEKHPDEEECALAEHTQVSRLCEKNILILTFPTDVEQHHESSE